MRRVTKEGVTFSEDIPLSPEVKKLIKDMLRYDPTDRITLGFITHTPWVTQSKISEQATYRALNPQEAMERCVGCAHGAFAPIRASGAPRAACLDAAGHHALVP